MICANGKECGTAPIWGLPFHVIHSIYLRDRDDNWIKEIYPYLKDFLEWWLENRTDEEGWFHAACSWESGQDASRRFLVPDHNAGAASEYVRTVDIEAAMANAMNNMTLFADITGKSRDVAYWKELADRRIECTRSMYVDGWFRDFDARYDKPIILKDYYDVMMLTPVALGIATEEQTRGLRPMFQYFKENPRFWLEWPSFLFPFSEAAWNAGLRELVAQVTVDIGNRIYPHLDLREVLPVGNFNTGLPEKYNYRIPGVSNEFWPVKFDGGNPGGCENYGWGATFPTLVIRNVIGFRETKDVRKTQFILAPALPPGMFAQGKTYGITNLGFCGTRSNVRYTVEKDKRLIIKLTCESDSPRSISVKDAGGKIIAKTSNPAKTARLSFRGTNYAAYTVTVE